ncbi:putative capsular polysaccharide biosynthesis protein [unidentified eubacterium SCB49]|nr:putative capsular polysaccharide biosynthesis protein [unidentified eubacterium SCB49]
MKIKDSILTRFYKGDNKLNLLNQRYLPRWIVVLIDTLLCAMSLALIYLLLYNTPVFFTEEIAVPLQAILLIGIHLFFFFLFKTYAGIVRHSTFTDILKLAFASSATFITVLVFNFAYKWFIGKLIFSVTLLFLYTLLSFVFLLLFRVVIKESYQIIKSKAKGVLKKRVAIIGADDQNISLARALTTESDLPFKLVGFLTEKLGSKSYKLLGRPVIPIQNNFTEIIEDYNIQGVLIIGETLSIQEKNAMVEQCLKNNIEVFNVPILEKWDRKEDARAHIKPIQIEDLLERETIGVQNKLIEKDLNGNVILVTGGAGSIGSEIVKQVAEFKPKLLIILDQAESALHELELYLNETYPDLHFITELANISNMYRLEQLYEKHKFKVIYHAAAYKHVPLIERNPHEAIFVNILGTVNLAVLATSNKVDKFVMVSTDKAVNPTNVMGASKRVAEMYVQSLQLKEDTHTRFITTRFGNVLGSNGSVIPYFRKQIAAGGPVTVTHKDIIRYFMTIPEACQLVLQAGTMGKGGEIFVFDMGKPIKILDMAKRMIRLSGFEPYRDIDIKITGLRPGEKLYEELLNDTSTTLPTHHAKIMITTVPTLAFDELSKKIKQLIKVATKHKDQEVVRLLKEIVPEYKSENSIFSKLDK